MLPGFRSESRESVLRGPDHRNVCTFSHRTELGGKSINHTKKNYVFSFNSIFRRECYAAGYVIVNDFSACLLLVISRPAGG